MNKSLGPLAAPLHSVLQLHRCSVLVQRFLKSNGEWRTGLFAITFLLIPTQTFPVNARGFVTHIDSPAEFEIGKVHVVMNARTQCERMEKYFHTKTSQTPCNSLHIAVGSPVNLFAEVNHSGQLSVTRVVLGMPQTRNSQEMERYGGQSKLVLRRTALLEEEPIIHHGEGGWHGVVWIDGYPTIMTSQTTLTIGPPSSFAVFHEKLSKGPSPINQLQPNVWVAYRSKFVRSGAIEAERLNISSNNISPSERNFQKQLTPVIVQPAYDRHIPGSIQYQHGDAIEILPDHKVQDYILRLGMEVVPQFQRNMDISNPAKIHFQFYVVYPFIHNGKSVLVEVNGHILRNSRSLFFSPSSTLNTPKQKSLVEDVIGMPDGTIIIPDVVLSRLNSEGQLASLLSYAITSIVQKQTYYVWRLSRQTLANVPLEYIAYPQAEQVLRVGIRQMYLAGYDIREAPYAWAVAQGKPVNNPVIDSKHPDKEIPWYAAYAFNYISQYYKDVDYSRLKRGEKEYRQFLQELYKADPSLKQPKAHVSKQ